MISRVKKVITKNGRSAGHADGDHHAGGPRRADRRRRSSPRRSPRSTQKYPDAVAAESIVFVRGKVDRKRETPSLLVNEVIPVDGGRRRG